ncbi:MAG: leucine-rich repeat domain-containing protein [Clostridia bacterium]|nr:leucine-rich repeat domain-containing protein [Clostridia bacterium]
MEENTMTFGDCPFCSRPFIFYPKSYDSFRVCPICGGHFYVGELIKGSGVTERELVPDLCGESFTKDGFVVENGVLVRYEGASQDIKIPSGVLAIGKCAFKGNTSIKSVDIPNGALYVCKSAFEGCEGIRTLRLPDTLLAIANNAFFGLRRLLAVNIPSSLVASGYATFQDCHNLSSLHFPMDMRYLGGSPCRYCRSLKSTSVPNCVTDDMDIWLTDVTMLERLVVGKGVHSIRTTWLGFLKEIEFLEPNGWRTRRDDIKDEEELDPDELKSPKRAARLFFRLSKTNTIIYRPDAKQSFDYHMIIE